VSARILVHLAGPTPAEVRVEGAAFHHLRVLRVEKGERLEAFDGSGRAFDAEVLAVEKDHALLRLGPARTVAPGRPIDIVQALPKGDKLELVLQKGTELGAHAFHPVVSERSVLRLSPARAEERRRRWQRIVSEAARQCGRNDVPVVHPVRPLVDAVRALPIGTRVLVLDEEERRVRLAEAAGRDAPLALVIGPEGGLSRAEVSALNDLGAALVSLGPLVLRTETAALAGIAVLRHADRLLG
jgi:16S rRNA (uracil1498-N3)-methyltransferase